ncbi:unnamed protein product [Urochloa humidicola]
MSARVDYNGSTGVMNVELQFEPSDIFYDAIPTYNLSAKVDLASVLPEQVAIGFSAAGHPLSCISCSLGPSAWLPQGVHPLQVLHLHRIPEPD